MIIGNGTMARAFEGLETGSPFLIFASGVANSKEISPEAFDREANLLIESMQKYQHLHLVYFSTCSIYDLEEQKTPYVLHKLAMEELIKNNNSSYNIFRVSNVAGFMSNKTTIFNYLVYVIQQQIPFELWANAYRNILAVSDINKVVMYLLQNKEYRNRTLNIANSQSYSVAYLVGEIEKFFQITANYELTNKGTFVSIDTKEIAHLFPKLGIHFTEDYIQQILRTYYSNVCQL